MMSNIPDFTKVALDAPVTAATSPLPAGHIWETPEGIPVKPVYTGADTAGFLLVDSLVGIECYLRCRYRWL